MRVDGVVQFLLARQARLEAGGVHAVPVGLGGDPGDAAGNGKFVGAVEEEDGHKIHTGMGVAPQPLFCEDAVHAFSNQADLEDL